MVERQTVAEDQEEALLERFLAEDRSAFDEIFERYHGRLLRLALLYGGEEAEAKDCVQEAFISLFRARRAVRKAPSLFPLLARMTVNACLQAKRSGKRRGEREKIAASADLDAPSPESQLEASELGRAMLKSFKALPATRKACTLLRLETDMAVSEIAKAAGTSYLAARLHIHRGMEAVRKAAIEFQRGAG